ncbi:MAG: GyrI-like domain-containing protein [Shimia sp.]|uniref:GyrI-like domain-containing protein n=1 Tax=Shimia sp. TaxID=1954381 RepID=UPI0040592479
MNEKLDFKKADKSYYSGKVGRWDRVVFPPLQFLSITGQGDPGGPDYARALGALYPLAYGIKFAQKAQGADFVVAPLEALWWADDPGSFVRAERDAWRWSAMIRMPEAMTQVDLDAAREAAQVKLAKKGADTSALAEVSLKTLEEGDFFQTLHVGPYSDEAPVLAHLHDVVMPEAGMTFSGHHHEIYLGDPRRVAPEKLRTILRQPVTRTG